MIHTIQLYTTLSFDERDEIQKRFNKNIVQVMEQISETTKGITLTGKGKITDYYLNIHVDVTKLLNKGDITEDDYYEVQNKIDSTIEYFVGYKLELTLLRIEYRVDKQVPSESERYILFRLYKKLIKKLAFKQRKYIKKKKVKEDKEENREKDDTSVLYDSGSMQLIIYDKDKERLDKEEESEEYEKNMIRYEVKVLNRHINYNKNKHKIKKTLKNYFKEDFQKKYMTKNIQRIVYKGDYYTIYHADNIISSSELKDKDKQLIREFLIDVSKYGISRAKSLKNKDKSLKYTKYKYKKIIKLLEELNINPILIPKNLKAPNGESFSYIKNPFNI